MGEGGEFVLPEIVNGAPHNQSIVLPVPSGNTVPAARALADGTASDKTLIRAASDKTQIVNGAPSNQSIVLPVPSGNTTER